MPTDATTDRTTDLRLARLHLRIGALALARAELETLAGRDALDDDGLADLAEVRWRTGDLTGGAEAAAVILGEEDDDGPVIAHIVAAEAAIARGRPSEARRHADIAIARAGTTLDVLFAGMPRGQVWPADPTAQALPAAELFDMPAVGPVAARAATSGDLVRDDAAVVAAETMGLWAADDATPGTAPTVPGLPVTDDELLLAREAMADGRHADAAVHLGLVIRLAPALAPVVLDIVGTDRDPALAFVRGDAYRLVGRETEARLAYADVARPLAVDGPAAASTSIDDASSDGLDHDDHPGDPHDSADPTQGAPA